MISIAALEDIVHLACRAPSYQNSQPWRWDYADAVLHLFVEADRLVETDSSGRQALISCGAALDHLRVASAAAGYQTNIAYYPDPNNLKHLAAVEFVPMAFVTEAHHRLADAILRRRTDRLPFAAPDDWAAFERVLCSVLDPDAAHVDVLSRMDRTDLAKASALSDALRLYDSAYHAEMRRWTNPFDVTDGIPHAALVSAAESDRVDIGRTFPVTHNRERRTDISEDESTVVVVSAFDDTRRDILACGEALSVILLQSTVAGFATCTLTHMTEVLPSRDIVSALTGRDLPQVLVRVGIAPATDEDIAPTPRRPLREVLHVQMP
jgi:hypothetical protein